MADVTPEDRGGRRSGPPRRSGSSTPRRGAAGRGQLLVVAALLLAIVFVALATVLNASIYAEALAAQGIGPSQPAEGERLRASAHDGLERLLVAVNEHNDSSHADLRAAMATGVADWDAAAAIQASADGGHASASLVGTDNGSRIAQETDRNFTDANGNGNWTLVGNASETRGFRVRITDVGALADAGDPQPFRIVVTDGTDVWRATVVDDGGDVQVTVEAGGTTTTCSTAAGPPVDVNLTAGTVGGQACPALRFGDDVGSGYAIAYGNASNVAGTYGLVVDDPAVAASPPPAYGSPSSPPNATPALYAARVEVVHEAPGARSVATVRLVPGDGDA